MQIAPGIDTKSWVGLNLDDDNSPDWQEAVQILKKRIESRYIEPVDLLIKYEEHLPANKRKFGFTILAIDLLLMETIQAFKEGLSDTIGKSKETFKNFLRDSNYFSPYFKNDEQRTKFYKEFRCAILHQAEIQGEALLWSIGDLKEQVDDITIINRTKIHEYIKKDLEEYLSLLSDKRNSALRSKFRSKMDSIVKRGKVA